MNGKKFKTINKTISCNNEASNQKETSGVYDNKGEEKTSRQSEKKEKARDIYVHMYECDNHFFHSTYQCALTSQDTTISTMEDIVKI